RCSQVPVSAVPALFNVPLYCACAAGISTWSLPLANVTASAGICLLPWSMLVAVAVRVPSGLRAISRARRRLRPPGDSIAPDQIPSMPVGPGPSAKAATPTPNRAHVARNPPVHLPRSDIAPPAGNGLVEQVQQHCRDLLEDRCVERIHLLLSATRAADEV